MGEFDYPAKNAQRNYLYEHVIPALMSRRELKQTRALILPGEDALELPFLAALGIPASRVYGVEFSEEHPDIYQRIVNNIFTGDYHISVQNTELHKFLRSTLQTTDTFGLMNLDINGGFQTHIAPALGEILTYCMRNPSTLVVSYHSGGRDPKYLIEGLSSLVAISQLVGSLDFFGQLFCRFQALFLAEKGQDIASSHGSRRHDTWSQELSVHAVERTMVWLRLHLDHLVAVEAAAGRISLASAKSYFEHIQAVRELVSRLCYLPVRKDRQTRLKPLLKFHQIERVFSELPAVEPIQLSLKLVAAQVMFYHGNQHFKQMCYCIKTQRSSSPVGLREWLSSALSALCTSEAVYFGSDGTRHQANQSAWLVPSGLVLWKDIAFRQFQFPTPVLRGGSSEILPEQPYESP